MSRYYDPAVGRFINADSIISGVGGEILGYNQYAYCFNNPVNLSDDSGNWPNFIKNIFDKIANAVEKLLTVEYDVPLYNQGNLNLCWAYCQTMVEDFKSNTIKGQEEADKRAKALAVQQNGNENWNSGNWPTNCKEYNVYGTPKAETKIDSIVDLYYTVKQNGPIYAYYYSEDISAAHLVVVTGVNLYRGLVYTNNPWGIAGRQEYSDFLDRFTGWNSDTSFKFCYYIFIE